MDKIPRVDRVSEYPAGSRQWWRDWSAFWMREAQECARASRLARDNGFADSCETWRRMAVDALRRSLKDYSRSLRALEASEWRP